MKKYNFNAGPSMLPREVIETQLSRFWISTVQVFH